MSNEKHCPKCNGDKFAEGSDFVNIRLLNKKMAMGSKKIYTFCLDCGEIVSIRVENPKNFI